MIGLSLVTPPSIEPVSLAEAKAHMRADDTDAEDGLIASLIVAARKRCETITRRALVTQTWDLVMDAFPPAIQIPLPPLASVTSITYLDTAGASQVLASSVYKVDIAREPGRITLKYNQMWPDTYPEASAVTVRFVAGYGGSDDVPEGIKAWIKLYVATLFENRELVILGQSVDPMPFTDGLLDDYRIYGFA